MSAVRASERPSEPVEYRGRQDQAARKQAKRSGRQRGCWVYIDAESLERAGFDPHGPAPFYRVWAHKRSANAGAAVVSLYRER